MIENLNRFYHLRKEAEDLANRLEEFGDGVKSVQIKDVVTNHSGNQPSIQERRQELFDLYLEKRVSALEECFKIEKFLSSVEDPEIREIIRFRNIDLLSWNDVASKMSSEVKDYTEYSVKKKYYRYFDQMSHMSQK